MQPQSVALLNSGPMNGDTGPTAMLLSYSAVKNSARSRAVFGRLAASDGLRSWKAISDQYPATVFVPAMPRVCMVKPSVWSRGFAWWSKFAPSYRLHAGRSYLMMEVSRRAGCRLHYIAQQSRCLAPAAPAQKVAMSVWSCVRVGESFRPRLCVCGMQGTMGQASTLLTMDGWTCCMFVPM
jgi:hypothetical protein